MSDPVPIMTVLMVSHHVRSSPDYDCIDGKSPCQIPVPIMAVLMVSHRVRSSADYDCIDARSPSWIQCGL